jgi:hypothetical protein
VYGPLPLSSRSPWGGPIARSAWCDACPELVEEEQSPSTGREIVSLRSQWYLPKAEIHLAFACLFDKEAIYGYNTHVLNDSFF